MSADIENNARADDSDRQSNIETADDAAQRKRFQKSVRRFVLRKSSLVVCAIVVFAVLACLAVSLIFGKISPDSQSLISCEDYSVSQSEFRFISAMYLESMDADEKAELRGKKEADALAFLKEKTQEYAVELLSLEKAASDSGLSLDENEKEAIKTSALAAVPEGKSKDGFYTENYGLDFDEYLSVKSSFAVAEKYLNFVEAKTPIDEEAQKKIYEKYADKISLFNVSMIFFDYTGLDDTEALRKNTNAKSVLESIESGRIRFEDAMQAYCEPNEIFEPAKISEDNPLIVGADECAAYAGLYDLLLSMKDGDVEMLNVGKVSIIVRQNGKIPADSKINADRIISIAKKEYVNSEIIKAKESAKSCIVINKNAVDEINLKDIYRDYISADK